MEINYRSPDLAANWEFLVKWQDDDAFFADYAASHKKLSELGFTLPSSGLKAITKNSTLIA
jgi:hypothetical protein